MTDPARTNLVGRAASAGPPNRYERVHVEHEQAESFADEPMLDHRPRVATEFLPDASQSILTRNDSPDISFRWSINPYRGCEHGCAYCYARPTHELLGFRAGLDFESRILVKHHAAELLRRELNHRGWKPQPIAISGVTDCYQPAERRFRLTRGLLEVLLEARQPVSIITKNALVRRDLDLLAPMAQRGLVHVFLSITTLEESLARIMEPRTATPSARLRTVAELSHAGVPVGVMLAPIIPGLNDAEIPSILRAARDAGAAVAGWTLLHLPTSVEPVFREWLDRRLPLYRDRVEALIRSTRGGHMNDARFGHRMRGQGEYAEQIARTFHLFAKRYGLDGRLADLNATDFRPPRMPGGQLRLF